MTQVLGQLLVQRGLEPRTAGGWLTRNSHAVGGGTRGASGVNGVNGAASLGLPSMAWPHACSSVPRPCPLPTLAHSSGALMGPFGTVALTTSHRPTPIHARGRTMGVRAAIRSWAETIGLSLGAATLAVLGIRAGGLAGVAIVAGIACLV